MRTLINYIRSLFCKHEMKIIFDWKHDRYFKRIYRCEKCGYSQKYRD